MQSAYKKNHSTETTLMRVQQDILSAMCGKKACLLVLLDLSSAFDTVDHCILLETLQELGVTGVALRWFASYLDSRFQYVDIGGKHSSSEALRCGVPQGSVLGPALFSLYTASLGRLLDDFGVGYQFYADDTSLYVTFEPGKAHDTIAHLEECLKSVHAHMVKKKLKMNTTKTDVLLISSKALSRKLPDIVTLTVGEDGVPISDAVQYIGVLLDERLSMVDHINSICRSTHVHIRNIARIRKMLSCQTCEQLVHALVTTKLDYANALLFGLPNVLMKKLQQLQNMAARVITFTPRGSHITPVLKQLHWLPVQ